MKKMNNKEAKERRFTDNDFTYFYNELMSIVKDYPNSSLYFGGERGYTKEHFYKLIMQMFTTIDQALSPANQATSQKLL